MKASIPLRGELSDHETDYRGSDAKFAQPLRPVRCWARLERGQATAAERPGQDSEAVAGQRSDCNYPISAILHPIRCDGKSL